MDISLHLNVGEFAQWSFLAFIVILVTKVVVALGCLVFGPKLDGQSFWIFAALSMKLTTRVILSLFVAMVIGVIASTTGLSAMGVMTYAVIVGVIGSLI